MSRLAWFTPWPPQRSGIAGRSAELVPLLAARGHAVDVFVDERFVTLRGPASAHPPAGGQMRLQSAHDFIWRQARGQYDLTIYQLGNSIVHGFTWPYLFRWPGLVVLHDTRLHHARAQALLSGFRLAEYRAEFEWNHPQIRPSASALAIRGFSGVYYYNWPMRRAVIESARLTAVHSRGGFEELRAESPDRPITYIALGEGTNVADRARARFIAAHALPESAVIFGVFGALTAEKRVPQVLNAFAAARARQPNAFLVLAGWADPQIDIPARLRSLGLTDAVRLLTSLDDTSFDEAIASVDVCICQRWPTAGETSGPWLRAMANGRATIITDLVHLGHVPSLDPRTWRRHAPAVSTSADDDAAAVTVAIDILDENHSLRLAMVRLAADAELRNRIGRAALAYWTREHTVARMADDYERAIEDALALPIPVPALPTHLRPDPLRKARQIMEPFDLAMPLDSESA